MSRRSHFAVFATILATFLCGQINAQPPQPVPETIREQTIYIPFEKLKEVFEKKGRGVFVPYEKFQELWKKARQATAPSKPKGAPVGSLVREMESEATIVGEVVRVSATIRIDLLRKGWHEVPLRLSAAALRSAKVGNAAARVIYRAKGGYFAILEQPDDKPRQIELQLEYAKAFTKTPGRNSISFAAPQAPINRWQIVIPQSGVKVDVKPFLASSAAPAGKPAGAKAPAKETRVLAFVGAAPSVQIDWTPKSEGAAGLSAIATVTAEQQSTIHQGVVRSQARLTYQISRAEMSKLNVLVPADQKIVNVFDPNVRKWSFKKVATGQHVVIELFEPARATQNVTIELEQVQNNLSRPVNLPFFQALDAGRQQGIVAVGLATGLRADPTSRSGLTQLDRQELPSTLAKRNWAYTFRYATLPFQLQLKVAKVTPRIRVDQLVETFLEPNRITQDAFLAFNIERAGVFQFQLEIPAGYKVRQVTGHTHSRCRAAILDADPYVLSGPNNTRMTVQLARRAIGKIGLRVQLQRDLKDDNLTKLTGTASEIPVPIVRVTRSTVEQSKGRLVVHARESLRVNPKQQDGVQTIPFTEARQGMPSLKQGRFPRSRELFAFAFAQEDVKLTLNAERRKPLITVAQLLVSDIQPGVVKHRFTFSYEIRFSGVESVRLDVPKSLADKLRVETGGIEKSVLAPQPKDVASDYVAWSLRGDNELTDKRTIELSWQQKVQELDVGKSQNVDLPVLKPMGVDRAWGQIVLKKTETLDVRAGKKPDGLRPIDPRHDLMNKKKVANAARAFEFHQEWSLGLEITRYQLEEIKRSSIEEAVLRMVVTPAKKRATFVQAMYRLRSARQRMVVQLPEDVTFDSQPLRINGRVVSLEKGSGGQYFIPLVGISPDKAFSMELRYTLAHNSVLQYPVFPQEPAVQRVYLCVYLPKDQVLLSASDPWVNEEANDFVAFLQKRGREQTDARFVSFVSKGVRFTGSPSFPTSGRLHVFSTLNPAGDQPLRITTVDRKLLNVMIITACAILAIGLFRQTLSVQIISLALLGIAYVGSGVLMPTFIRQITSPITFMSLGAVALLWAARAVTVAGNDIAQLMRQRTTATPEETPVEQDNEPSNTAEVTDSAPSSSEEDVVFVDQEDPPPNTESGDEQVIDLKEQDEAKKDSTGSGRSSDPSVGGDDE